LVEKPKRCFSRMARGSNNSSWKLAEWFADASWQDLRGSHDPPHCVILELLQLFCFNNEFLDRLLILRICLGELDSLALLFCPHDHADRLDHHSGLG
jgi:hypothetical protein